MSYNYCACQDTVIDKEDLRLLCPEEYDNFMEMLNTPIEHLNINGFDSFCDFCLINNDKEKADEPIMKSFAALQKAFNKKTGFNLKTEYIGGDTVEINEGSLEYNHPGYFTVTEPLYVLTHKAKKLLELCPNSGTAYWVSGG